MLSSKSNRAYFPQAPVFTGQKEEPISLVSGSWLSPKPFPSGLTDFSQQSKGVKLSCSADWLPRPSLELSIQQFRYCICAHAGPGDCIRASDMLRDSIAPSTESALLKGHFLLELSICLLASSVTPEKALLASG